MGLESYTAAWFRECLGRVIDFESCSTPILFELNRSYLFFSPDRATLNCAPAKRIKPETYAQKIKPTETKNGP